MKLKLLIISMLCASITHASHIIGGEINITHVQGFQYVVELSVYRDATGITPPAPSALINVYQRSNATQMGTFTVPLQYDSVVPPVTVGCGSPLLLVEHWYYSDTIQLPPTTYNSQNGYFFIWSSCCRNPGVQNLMNSSSSSSSVVTYFPPVVDGSGNQFINSTSSLNSPLSDFAINRHPYYLDFSGLDADGDSLSYSLYTPFEQQSPIVSSGNVINSFAPINWQTGFSLNSVIPGMGGAHNNLSINATTGQLTMVPDVPGSGYYVYGIRVDEFRNGNLIASTFRDFQISILDISINPNTAPQVHVSPNQGLASWNADTLVFTGSPVCVTLGVTDPDSIADVEVEVVYTDYDPGDVSLLANYGIILNPDTFLTSICFQPDSFLPTTTQGQVVALNPGCYDLRGDTLPFYFQFVGYSNAGWGGTQSLAIGQNQGPINLLSLMQHNPNIGGTWYDLDNSGALQSDGTFFVDQITTPGSYRFMYIDQQPNYPADTGRLTLNFVFATNLTNSSIEGLNLYPNPANDEVVLTGNAMVGKVSIFNLQGKLVKTLFKQEEALRIQTSDLEDGIYLIELNGVREKLIIN